MGPILLNCFTVIIYNNAFVTYKHFIPSLIFITKVEPYSVMIPSRLCFSLAR